MAEAPRDEPLEAQILTVLRELPSGDVVRLPVADPTLACIGSRDETRAELSAFLSEHLGQISPPLLARFVSPPGAALESVDVLIERDDLPRRLQLTAPIRFRAVVMPAGRARWVFIPVLGHVAYVGPDEVLEDALRAEIRRLVSASEPSGLGWLALLGAPSEALEIMPVEIDRRERAPAGRAASLHQQLAQAAKARAAREVLDSLGVQLDGKSAAVFVGREAELATLSALLASKNRQSVLVVGRERVGKTALVLAWLQGERKAGRTRCAMLTSGAELVAGMSALGQWQERLKRTLEAAELLDAVLVFDDLSDLFGDKTGQAIDLAGSIRPWLEQGRVRVVGELTPEALQRLEPRDVGFFSAFARVRAEPLDGPRARLALEARAKGELTPRAIETIVELGERYQPYRPLPEKWIAILEETRARVEPERAADGIARPIDGRDVLEAFSQSSGIPQFLLREDRALVRDQVTAAFRRRLIGQSDAIARVVDVICVVKAGLQPTGKPLATFLFVGPTGVGKTELARTLAEFLFGAPDRLLAFDMSEYSDAFAAARLFGGGGGDEGQLTRQVRQQPFSVLLLDEIEKAHAGVFDLLLQITGEGRLTDTRGHTAYFHNCIVIMTSNLGAAHRKSELGIAPAPGNDESYYRAEVERAFRPELVNRFDRVITFAALTPAEVEQVATLAVAKLSERRGFGARKVSLEVRPEAQATLARRGYSPHYGARALRRELENRLVAPAARLLAATGAEVRASTLIVSTSAEPVVRAEGPSIEHDGLRLQLSKRALVEPADTGAIDAAFKASSARSRASRAFSLDAAVRVREAIDTLIATLARKHKQDPKRGADLAMHERDLHHLQSLWAAADAPYQDMIAAEELAMSAFLTGQSPADAKAVALDASHRFERAFALILLNDEPSKHHAMLRVTEVDDGRFLGRWLTLLRSGAERRGWTVLAHLPGERRADWPERRYFGPPRPLVEAIERLAQRDGRGDVLLAIEGPWASALLTQEAGVHHFAGLGGRVDPTMLWLRIQSGRTEFTDDEWMKLFMSTAHDPKVEQLRKLIVREFDARTERLVLVDGEIEMKRDLSNYFEELERIAYAVLTFAAELGR